MPYTSSTVRIKTKGQTVFKSDHIAGAGGETATLTYLKGGLKTDGDGPTGGVLRDIGLINPRACQIQASGYLALGLLEVGTAAGGESLVGVTLQLNVLNAPLLTATTFLLTATIAIDHKHVGFDNVQRGHKVHHATASIDIGILDIADALDHKQELLLGIDGLTVLEPR